MGFRAKIWIVLTFVGIVPALVMGWLSLQANRAELEATVGRMQSESAENLGRHASQFVLHAVENLRLAIRYIPFDALSPDELSQVLAIPYRQFPFVRAVALVDARGKPVTRPVYAGAETTDEPERQLSPSDLLRFGEHIPLNAALRSEVATSQPYRGDQGHPCLAVAVRVPGEPARVLAAEISLKPVADRARALSVQGTSAWFMDGKGYVIAGPSGVGSTADERALLTASVLNGPQVGRVKRADGSKHFAAVVSVPSIGWGAGVSQPEGLAFAAVDRVRTYSLFWALAAVLAVIVLGAVLARGVARPIQDLSAAARQLEQGRYDHKVDVDSDDELGQFATAFNRMAEEIRRREEEIRGWNTQLQARVEERTAELRAAQDQIQRSRRLAAVGSLGAGVAHELNNPMTAIMGLVTIVRNELGRDTEHGQVLDTVLNESRRVVQIVGELRQLAEREREGGGCRFSLAGAVRSSLQRHSEQMAKQAIRLTAELDSLTSDIRGNPEQIERVVDHLLTNALKAMPSGGALKVQVAPVEGQAVKLAVVDSGKGIPRKLQERIFDPFFTTKEDPRQVGLGLSITHSIVEAHHGRILVDSAEGQGSTFTVVLPKAEEAAHLA